jgi:hypothetical protein
MTRVALADTTAIVAEIDALLARAGLAPRETLAQEYALHRMKGGERSTLITSWSAAVVRLAGPSSTYASIAKDELKRGANSPAAVANLSGVLVALRDDYEAGYLRSIEELLHADLFADFLEMADELLKKHYKDPAAVIAGSVLEEHLRKLAEKNSVPTTAGGHPKKADTLNAELVKKGVYNKLEQKNVTAWLGLRNNAAHGDYDKYDATQVRLLVDNVRAFLSRYPA